MITVLHAQPLHAQGQAVASVRVEGTKTVESSLVLSRFPLATGDRYVPALVREGIKALYGLGLFEDVKVLGETREDGRVDLIVRVSERPRIGTLRFQGNEHIGTEELTDRIKLGKGQIYDPSAVEGDRREIVAAYREEGYPLAAVEAVAVPDPAQDRVNLTFTVEEGERIRLRKVEFLGNSDVSADDLRDAMETRTKGFLRSGRFQQEKFEEDLERIAAYYHDHGYRDARVIGSEVAYSEDQRDMSVSIRVDEGPLYTLEKPLWSGNQAVSDKQIEAIVPWEEGDPYSAAEIAEFKTRISEAFTEQGYLLGFDVRDRETVLEGHRVQVGYEIQEGEPSKVGEIRITGNTRTKERVIRRELAIYPGQTFRRSLLARSQREVFALGFFDDVQVDFEPRGAGSDVIDLELKVQERRLGTAGAGMGFSSATGLTGFLQVGHTNLFGNGWNANVHVERGSKQSQYEFSFTEPWLFDRPISAGFELFDTEISRDVFDDHRRGAGVTVGWPFPKVDYTRGFVSFRVQDVSIPFVDPSLSEESVQRLREGEGTIVSTTVGANRNTTDNPFYPTSGSRSSWSSEFTGGVLGGSVDFHKHILDHRAYVRPFWKPVIMFRTRLGVLQPYTRGTDVPGYESFRLGGTLFNYLRGYDDYDVVPEENITIDSLGRISRFPGGKFMATFTLEYQFPVAHPLHGLFFLDAGDTWNSRDDFSLNGFRRGAGFGLRMEVPMLGILGLDYAYGFDRDGGAKWKPHLIFGRQF